LSLFDFSFCAIAIVISFTLKIQPNYILNYTRAYYEVHHDDYCRDNK